MRPVKIFKLSHFQLRRCFFIPIFAIVIFSLFYYIFTIFPYNLSSIFSLVGPRLIRDQESLPPLLNYDVRSKSTNPDDTIYILAWTKRFLGVWPDESIRNCARAPQARCYLTSAREFLNRSAAILFHARDLNLFTDIPSEKYRHQKYIFHNHESPLLTRVPLQGAIQKSFFDWTMTYRLDSTIFCPYAYLEPLNHTSLSNFQIPEFLDVRLENDLEKRPKLVAWFVSNCETDSKREYYVHELRKYIRVDIFGDCGEFRCPKNERRRCLQILAQNYKFYIGFENSVCKDYVSEKFLHRLDLNLVIIILRRSDYENIVPRFPNGIADELIGNSSKNDKWIELRRNHKTNWWFFIAADDFDDSKDLADYLKFLNENPEEYLKYFEWKKYWRVVVTGDQYCFCELCSKLYLERERLRTLKETVGTGGLAVETRRNVRFDIHEWWNVGTCVANFAKALVKTTKRGGENNTSN